MSTLQKLAGKARHSVFYRWVLNRALDFTIPFNKPHHLKVLEMEPGYANVKLPFRKSNLNHVKSLHACALATLCEYTTGLALVGAISESEYRILLKNINISYHYQGKSDAAGSFRLAPDFITDKIIKPLELTESVTHEFQIEVYDTHKNHICTGVVTWQIKKWSKVKLK